MWTVLVAVCACSWSTVQPPPSPAPAPAPPEVHHAWVHASLLRLREQPNPDAAWSPLAIGTRVRILESQADWVRVIAPDGRSGWVRAEFVGDAPLTLDDVRNHLASAVDPADKVTWYERGAALAPTDPELLAGLVAAYRAADRAADADRLDAVMKTDEGDRFDRWFPAQREEVAAITAALPTTASADDLIGLWTRARDVTAAMGEPLGSLYDGRAFVEGDPSVMLSERMPWAELALYAEGTVPALELSESAWNARSRATPEAWDDAFFELVTMAYANASARGWTSWQVRNWDYGGCSPFGSGGRLHLELLRRTDALGKVPPVAGVVAEIRQGVLLDIEKPVADEFPYCVRVGEPTPIEGLLAEANAILAEVALTDDERRRIQARVDGRFGHGG